MESDDSCVGCPRVVVGAAAQMAAGSSQQVHSWMQWGSLLPEEIDMTTEQPRSRQISGRENVVDLKRVAAGSFGGYVTVRGAPALLTARDQPWWGRFEL